MHSDGPASSNHAASPKDVPQLGAPTSDTHDDVVSRLDSDSDFQRDFHKDYVARQTLLRQHLRRLMKLLGDKKDGLDGSRMIKHQPFASRLKDEKSAIKTLGRRQNERLALERLKVRLEACGQKWEDYWDRQPDPPYWINDCGHYQGIDDMLAALPDIGGMRVCVYKPEDVEKVVEYLDDLYEPETSGKFFDHRKHLLAKPPQVIRRGQGPDYLHDLKHHIRSLEAKRDIHTEPAEKVLEYQDVFPGYRATHVRVQLKPDLVEDEVHLDGEHTVEIQILTVIMDAWAHIVHDIIYKPDMPPTDSQRFVLSSLNGVVLTGESVLTQLSHVQADVDASNAHTSGTIPSDRYELGAWLRKACLRLDPSAVPLSSSDPSTAHWAYLGKLLKVLDVTHAHTYKDLQHLLEKAHANNERKVITQRLPVYILRALLEEKNEKDAKTPTATDKNGDEIDALFGRIRQNAGKVVHIINMAMFLDVGPDFVEYTILALKKMRESRTDSTQGETPSMIEMLDLLHHTRPQLREGSMRKMQNFCQDFCDKSRLADVVEDEELLAVLELPRMLVNAGYVARPIFEEPSDDLSSEPTTIVPRELCAFLDDNDDTHFIPEILNFAQKIADKEDASFPVPKQETTAAANGILAKAASVTRWFGSRRMRFEPESDDEKFLHVTVDRKDVPMRWTFDENEGTMALEIDKNPLETWPHPGFFSTTVCPKHGHGKFPRWKYDESKADDWTLKLIQDGDTPSRHVRNKTSGENDFLRLFRRLHPDCKEIEPVTDDTDVKQYHFWIKNKRFCLSSTTDKYILRKAETKDQ